MSNWSLKSQDKVGSSEFVDVLSTSSTRPELQPQLQPRLQQHDHWEDERNNANDYVSTMRVCIAGIFVFFPKLNSYSVFLLYIFQGSKTNINVLDYVLVK